MRQKRCEADLCSTNYGRASSAAWCWWRAASADRTRHRHSVSGGMGGFGRPMIGGPIWRHHRLRAAADMLGPTARPVAAGRHGILRSSGAAGASVAAYWVAASLAAATCRRRCPRELPAAAITAAARRGRARQFAFVPDEIVTFFCAGHDAAKPSLNSPSGQDLAHLEAPKLPADPAPALYRCASARPQCAERRASALGNENTRRTVQPNYLFALAGDQRQGRTTRPRSAPAAGDDPPQYVLRAVATNAQAHQIATGQMSQSR